MNAWSRKLSALSLAVAGLVALPAHAQHKASPEKPGAEGPAGSSMGAGTGAGTRCDYYSSTSSTAKKGASADRSAGGGRAEKADKDPSPRAGAAGDPGERSGTGVVDLYRRPPDCK